MSTTPEPTVHGLTLDEREQVIGFLHGSIANPEAFRHVSATMYAELVLRAASDLIAARAIRNAAANMRGRIHDDWQPNFRQGAQWAADCLDAIADCRRDA